MRWCETFIPTLREPPAAVKRPGVQWLIRGGFLRLQESESAVFLPLLIRVLDKLRRSITAAARSAGGCPIGILPAWKASGIKPALPDVQLDKTLDALGIFARREIRSYRQLPLACYFREQWSGGSAPCTTSSAIPGAHEWFGLLCFAADEKSARSRIMAFEQAAGQALAAAGLPVYIAKTISGGEELIAPAGSSYADRSFFVCQSCGFTAAPEAVSGRPSAGPVDEECLKLTRVATPGAKTVDQVTAFLGVPAHKLIKTLLYKTEREVIGALIRGDRTLNEIKLRQALQAARLELLDAEGVQALTGAAVGFSGPVGLRDVRLIADREVLSMRNFVVGANADNEHLINTNLADFAIAEATDLRDAIDGDLCVSCDGGILRRKDGFLIGCAAPIPDPRVSGILFDGETGMEIEAAGGTLFIDLTAALSAIAENHHDARGLCWPPRVAPYNVHLLTVNPDDQEQADAARQLIEQCVRLGLEVLYDDRPIRMGGRFFDADLIGIPSRLVIGPKKLAAGLVEHGLRATGEVYDVSVDKAVGEVARWAENAVNGPKSDKL